jgi:hypothetical protein
MKTFMDELLAEAEEKEQRVKIELDRLKADQLLMAVAKLDSQIEDANKLCDDEIKLIEQYRKSEIERIEKKRSWLLFNLEGFARQQLEAGGEKTMRLPHGALALRKGRDKIEILDMELFMKVAPRYGFLRVTPENKEPDMTALAAFVKRTKQIPLGTKLTPATINFSYQLTTNGDNNVTE